MPHIVIPAQVRIQKVEFRKSFYPEGFRLLP